MILPAVVRAILLVLQSRLFPFFLFFFFWTSSLVLVCSDKPIYLYALSCTGGPKSYLIPSVPVAVGVPTVSKLSPIYTENLLHWNAVGNSWTAPQSFWGGMCFWGWGRCSTVCSISKPWRTILLLFFVCFVLFSWKVWWSGRECYHALHWGAATAVSTEMHSLELGALPSCVKDMTAPKKKDCHLRVILIMTCQKGATLGSVTGGHFSLFQARLNPLTLIICNMA